MTISKNTPVGEVVKSNFTTAALFRANNIDFCCGGEKSISEACQNAGVDTAQLIKQLEEKTKHVDPDSEYISNLELDELIDYIVKRHHSYVRESTPFLNESITKVCTKHGENHPEMIEIQQLFNASAGELTMHMQKEELMLFPYIKNLVLSYQNHTALPASPFGSVSNPIQMMISEHQNEGERFEKIDKLSSHYLIPDDACTTYFATMKHLKNFEKDLHRHIHLENNILFPKAVELEARITAGN